MVPEGNMEGAAEHKEDKDRWSEEERLQFLVSFILFFVSFSYLLFMF